MSQSAIMLPSGYACPHMGQKAQTIHTIWVKLKGLSTLNKPGQGRSLGLDPAVTCFRGVRDGEDRSHE